MRTRSALKLLKSLPITHLVTSCLVPGSLDGVTTFFAPSFSFASNGKISKLNSNLITSALKSLQFLVVPPQFEPFPQLEPFPFEANPPGPAVDAKKCGAPPVRKPGKFVQGQFMESDYESHLDSSRIPSRWLPAGSDTEETSSFKKIQLPKLSTDKPAELKQGKCPSPPSKYDVNPPQYVGPPRPEFKKPSPPVQTEFKLPTPPNQPESKLPTQPEGSPRKPSITGTETVQRMQMEESTRFSKRFVTGKQIF